LPEWECLKCHYRWIDEERIEPKFCPRCGSQSIYVPSDSERKIGRGLKAAERYRKVKP